MKSKRCAEGPVRGRSADFSPGKVIACHLHHTAKISKASDNSKSFLKEKELMPRPGPASVPLDGRPALRFGGVVGGRNDRCRVAHLCRPCPVDTRRRRRPLPEAAPHRGPDEPPNVDLGEQWRDAAPWAEDAGRLLSRLQLQAGLSRASGALAWVGSSGHSPTQSQAKGEGCGRKHVHILSVDVFHHFILSLFFQGIVYYTLSFFFFSSRI